MKTSNIFLGKDVEIETSSSINNIKIGDNVKIAKNCSIYGGPDNLLEIGNKTYIGMNTIINGFSSKIKIGKRVSIAQNVNIMSDSGPNASEIMQKIFPIKKKEIIIGDDCWIGTGSIIMPGVKLGKMCVVAANSFVKDSFKSFSVIGGNPAKLIKKIKNNG